MELIDREALKEELDRNYGRHEYCLHDAIEDIINSVPTIEERKTGKWVITKRNGILCGVCHSGLRRMPTIAGMPMFRYCPFCGAEMKGAEE